MENKKKILENFLNTIEMPGVCGFQLLEDDLGLQVIIIIDLEYIQEYQTKPSFIAKRIRLYLIDEIKKYLGFNDVYVGSTAKKCSDLKESKSTQYIITENQLSRLIKKV